MQSAGCSSAAVSDGPMFPTWSGKRCDAYQRTGEEPAGVMPVSLAGP